MRSADDLARIAPDALARFLAGTSGLEITPGMVEADVASGAPTNPDGSINLLHYVAWLAREDRGARA